jgi:hypothetical protein
MGMHVITSMVFGASYQVKVEQDKPSAGEKSDFEDHVHSEYQGAFGISPQEPGPRSGDYEKHTQERHVEIFVHGGHPTNAPRAL